MKSILQPPKKPIHDLEVPTIQPRVIRSVHNQRAIAKVRWRAGLVRNEKVRVQNIEALAVRRPDRAVLAAEVADFAGLGRVDVAGGRVGAFVGVQVAAGGVAVAVFGDAVDVDVVF